MKLACRRHLNDLKRAKSDKAWGYYFDRWHGDDVCDFVEKLPHVEGQWETATLFLEPAEIFILATVFGWRRNEDGGRRFSDVYIEMARKGAKSTLTAGVGLYCLCCGDETGPQVIVGATTGDQAQKVFKPMLGMVRRSPDLQEAFAVRAWSRSITRLGVRDFDTAGRGADVAAYGAELDRLRAKYNPLFAVIRQYRSEIAEVRNANRLGVISEDEMVAAINRRRTATLASIQTIKGISATGGERRAPARSIPPTSLPSFRTSVSLRRWAKIRSRSRYSRARNCRPCFSR